MKKQFSIYLLGFLLSLPLLAQWEDAVLSEVPSQTGTATHAKGVLDNGNTTFIAWETNAQELYFASRATSGEWSLPEKISSNVITGSTQIASRGGNTFVVYAKSNGANSEIWLSQIAAPFSIESNTSIISDSEPKSSLSIDVDLEGYAHVSWAMNDNSSSLNRVYYYNNSETGEILGANKVPISNMDTQLNPLSINATESGSVEILYIGSYQNDQIIQRTFNNEFNSTSWNYDTYFDFGPSNFKSAKSTINGNLLYYAVQELNGQVYFFQGSTSTTNSWIPVNGNATVVANEGILESIMVMNDLSRHCLVVGDDNEVIHVYTDSNGQWQNDFLLTDGNYVSGNFEQSSINELYWMGVKDGKAAVFGPEVTTSIHNFIDEGLKLYPNPSSDWVNIEAAKGSKYSISIYNVEGRMVAHDNFSNRWNINVSNWQKGVYFVKIGLDGQIFTQKLLVQ